MQILGNMAVRDVSSSFYENYEPVDWMSQIFDIQEGDDGLSRQTSQLLSMMMMMKADATISPQANFTNLSSTNYDSMPLSSAYQYV